MFNRRHSSTPDSPLPPAFWKPARLLFRCVLPAAATGWYVVLFGGPHLLAFVGPFLGLAALQESLLWLFRFARRMGATDYEILRKE
jgi:hypothetical protein